MPVRDKLEPIADVVANGDLSWARLYFDSSPARHAPAWRLLASFGDDSQTYYWRVLAAREIMRLYRHDRSELRRLIVLQNNKASAEEVLHPPDSTERFEDARRHRPSVAKETAPAAAQQACVASTSGSTHRWASAPPAWTPQPARYRGLRAEALVESSDREIVAILDALENYVTTTSHGPAALELDGRRYRVHPRQESELPKV